MGNDLDRVRFGPYEVDLHTHELWKFGTRIRVVGQPFEILAVLLSQPGELVTREELRARLWPSDTFVDFNHGLNAAVNKLRDALSDSADDPRYIETLPRRGYRFIGKVERPEHVVTAQPKTALNRPAAEIESVASVVLRTDPAITPALPTKRRLEFRHAIGLIATFAVLLVATFFLIARYIHTPVSSASVSVQRMRPLLSVSETYTPAFSPDGNSVAFYTHDSTGPQSGIYVTAVGSNQYIQLSKNDDDCCPVWSPDGKWIAFTRANNHQYSIYVVPSDGGGEEKLKAEKALTSHTAAFKLTSAVSVERQLDTGNVIPQRGEIDWSPDGKSIVFSGSSGLYIAGAEDASVRRLTQSPLSAEDWGGQFSPDGSRVLFVRTHQIGIPDEIYPVPCAGGDPSRVLSEPGKIESVPRWSYDGRSVIFSSNRTGHPALWRAALEAPDSVVEIAEAGSPAWDPIISRRGNRLAFERLFRSLSIWQMDLESNDKRPYVLVSSTSDTDQGPGPQFSPDGQKLAYMSDRNGTMEIWIANRDGSNPFQLSAVGTAGTPRWSPDSQSIAFDANANEGSKIVTMNVHGGPPQILTPDKTHNVCPSWSRDGKWIYFASQRSGTFQVWKVPSSGGTPIQVTQQGGHADLESLDGKYIYYAKNAAAEPEIWRVPAKGGEEKLVPMVRPGTWASWQVVEGGILFVGPALGHQAALSFYDAAKDRTTTITLLNRIPFWLGATPDGKRVAFDQPGREQNQTMLVENFR